ncbi:uncharacterized protein LOC115233889 isoform X2 [Formica exsecta]|uniref:uncharacterized protein LOC115233889 isoform X2 n=1 Tax=Formica exsecta TaxID=72781 RepID=UPI001144CBAF|nr:uncharacterized protein LOC115233889 isoform X2 [Formica exsecta]
MHFMIHTLRIIIFAILISNIITKQNENTTSRNNTHTIKESDDDEYVDIKNKELDNNIKNNESDKSKDVKNVDMVSKLIILYITIICVCTLVIVIKNCRWENISQCNGQCQLGIRRNYLIVRDCCRQRFRDDINTDDQPSYHAEHFCEDFCRWCLAFDYFNFRRSNPNHDHQPERAACVRRIEVAEASVIFDGSNVSIQEHHANFRKSNPNPDHQPERAERAERAQFAERAQCVERAQVHAEAEPSIICDWSSVSIQEHHANFCRSNPNPDHQPERAERAQRVEHAQAHVEAEPSIIYDWSNVSIQEQTVFMETDF